jgi:hypothetical protein
MVGMTRTLDFHKIGKSWYADVPGWNDKLEDLEMIMGADVLLDALSNNGRFIRIQVSDQELLDSIHFHINEKIFGGTEYAPVGKIPHEINTIDTIWLCSVNNFFWSGSRNDEPPKDIYFKVTQYV